MRRTESISQRQPDKKKKNSNTKQIVKRILLATGIVFVLLIAIIAGAAFGFIDNSTDLIAQEYNLELASVVYYTDPKTNEVMEYNRVYADQNRVWVDLEKTPEMLKKAFIAIEDERFESHNGVDWKRTFGATIGYIFKGSDSYGGSTITQQLIKNVTGDNDRSPIRKIQEIVRALNLERKMSKDEIIEMYMNTIYLGQGCHGVQSAANVYYSKDVSELSLAECASIAGITQYPSKYDPLVNYDANKQKQEVVLKKMLELGYITKDEYDQAVSEELKLKKGTTKVDKSRIQSYFTDQIIMDVIQDLMTRNNMSESEATKLIFKGGLKIYSTVDPKVQSAMENIFENDKNFPGSGENKPQSAMVVMDPYTGEVKGIVGGRGQKTGNRVLNRATQSMRQPGSSIKPLAVYAPAIENGIITPATIVNDSSLTIGNWSPKNSDGSFLGPITARVALEKSRNVPAVRILDKLSVDRSFDFMTKKLGFTTLVSSEKRADGKNYSDKYLSSLGLGGLTDGVTVMEMTAAYSTFVNQGIYTKPITYTKVTDANGRVILENKPETNRAMSETTAYTMAQMLSGVVTYGTGTAAKPSGIFAGGKTGTTDKDVDRWFAGFTPNYVGVVWFGYDNPKSMSGLGNPCTSTWRKVMEAIHKDVSVKTLVQPQNMTAVTVCQVTGKVAGEECESTRVDYFKSGTQPPGICSSHAETEPEDKIDGTIENEGQGLNEVAPGSGTSNPPPEGEGITQSPSVPSTPSTPNESPVADDESQYWWSGEE
ncbi:MAG: PBP1A family penicillin-binding protein [Clostridia bacterium]|nr:PBP1A family penicillin-binding protein [Clostridia bacterium]